LRAKLPCATLSLCHFCRFVTLSLCELTRVSSLPPPPPKTQSQAKLKLSDSSSPPICGRFGLEASESTRSGKQPLLIYSFTRPKSLQRNQVVRAVAGRRPALRAAPINIATQPSSSTTMDCAIGRPSGRGCLQHILNRWRVKSGLRNPAVNGWPKPPRRPAMCSAAQNR
jgi:hypothetical protein